MLIRLNNFIVEAKLQSEEDIFFYNFKNKEGLVPFSFVPFYREDINKFKKEIKEALNNQKGYLDLNKNKNINIKKILKNEIKEALAYPTSKSYINMYKETLNYHLIQ